MKKKTKEILLSDEYKDDHGRNYLSDTVKIYEIKRSAISNNNYRSH